MERPFRFIEYKTTHRKEFEVTEGRQPTFALFFLKEGSFRLKMGEVDTVIGAGECAIFADDVDFTRFVIEPISFVYLKFTYNKKCTFVPPLPVGRITFRHKDRFLSDIERYEALTEAEDPRSVYLREHLLEDILLRISDEYTAAGGGQSPEHPLADCHDPLILACVSYVREHLGEKLRTDVVCRALSTNQTTLNFKFRRAFSMSLGDFITAERMRQARRYLTNTTFSVGTVAERCGYENIYYFSTAFRKANGCSPTQYRRAHRV